MTTESTIAELNKHLPNNLGAEILNMLKHKRALLTITNKRTSKLGDYRRPTPKFKYHRISVNGNLNPYSFLITFIHEFAHLEAYERFKNKILPHGKEWKSIFGSMLLGLLERGLFPNDIALELTRYAKNPKASTVSDSKLMMALKNHDRVKTTMLNDLPENAFFRIGKKIFKKEGKRRTRFLCTELNSQKKYVVSGLAEVKLISITEVNH